MLPLGNENSERESNPMPYRLYLCLSRSAFFTDPNEQLPNLKAVFKFFNCGFSVSEIYRFITFLGIEIIFFIKQCPLKFMSDNK